MPWFSLTASLGFLLAGFLVGWVIRSVGLKKRAESDLTSDLLTAVARSIEGHRDEAIRLLTQLTSRNSATIDPFLTLGMLFRRKGWLHRAVDVHRHLLNRSDITDSMRSTILLETARDYLECGLLDRAAAYAEKAFQYPDMSHESARFLARIFERERNWSRAISWWRRAQGDIRKHKPIAYIQALQITELIERSDVKPATKMLLEVAIDEPENVALLLEAIHLFLIDEDLIDGLAACRTFLTVRPDLTGYLIDMLKIWKLDIPESLEKTLLDWFLMERNPFYSGVEQVDLLILVNRSDDAVHLLETIPFKQLSRERLAKYFDIAEQLNRSDLASQSARELIGRSISRESYGCMVCGNSFGRMSWRCPHCESWGSLQVYKLKKVDDTERDKT